MPPFGESVSLEELKDGVQDSEHCIGCKLLFLDCSSLVSASSPFPDQGSFEPALQKSGKGIQKGFCAQEPYRDLLDFTPRVPFTNQQKIARNIQNPKSYQGPTS